MALRHRDPDPQSSPTRLLTFSESGGPLVAVAGLCGGAGVSTLAHLFATAAAKASSAPILLVETGGPSATLSVLTGAASRRSLVDLAREVEAGHPSTDPPFAVVNDGLRVIGSGPQFEREAGEAAIETVFDDARTAHGLTVVDCSTLASTADLVALRRATHIVWVAPTTELASLLASVIFDALELPLVGRELLAVRHALPGAAVPATKWTAIAQQRDCDVVLVPHVDAVGELPLADRIDQAAVALDALAGALR